MEHKKADLDVSSEIIPPSPILQSRGKKRFSGVRTPATFSTPYKGSKKQEKVFRLNSTPLVPLRVDVELPPEPELPSPILSSSRRTRIPNQTEAIGRKLAILLPDDSQDSLEEDQILGNSKSNDQKQEPTPCFESGLGLQSEVRAEPGDGILDGKLESEIDDELEPGTCVEKYILGDEPCSPVLSSQRSRREETDLTDGSIEWTCLMEDEESINFDSPAGFKIAASLGCKGTPVTWDTRFETPLSNLVPATDENGKMKWDNMNTIERIHLSPSRPKNPVLRSSRPPSRNLFSPNDETVNNQSSLNPLRSKLNFSATSEVELVDMEDTDILDNTSPDDLEINMEREGKEENQPKMNVNGLEDNLMKQDEDNDQRKEEEDNMTQERGAEKGFRLNENGLNIQADGDVGSPIIRSCPLKIVEISESPEYPTQQFLGDLSVSVLEQFCEEWEEREGSLSTSTPLRRKVGSSSPGSENKKSMFQVSSSTNSSSRCMEQSRDSGFSSCKDQQAPPRSSLSETPNSSDTRISENKTVLSSANNSTEMDTVIINSTDISRSVDNSTIKFNILETPENKSGGSTAPRRTLGVRSTESRNCSGIRRVLGLKKHGHFIQVGGTPGNPGNINSPGIQTIQLSALKPARASGDPPNLNGKENFSSGCKSTSSLKNDLSPEDFNLRTRSEPFISESNSTPVGLNSDSRVGLGTLKPKILYSSSEEKFQENLEEFNPEMSRDKLSKFDQFFETLCHDANPVVNATEISENAKEATEILMECNSTASGKKVEISEKALIEAKEKMGGFSTASGKKVEISEKALIEAKEKMGGFSTASGKKVEISEKALNEANSKFLSKIHSDVKNVNQIKNIQQGQENCDFISVITDVKSLKPEIKTVIPETDELATEMNAVIMEEDEFFLDEDDEEFSNMAAQVGEGIRTGEDGKGKRRREDEDVEGRKRIKVESSQELKSQEERERNRLKQRNLISGKLKKLIRPVEGELTRLKKTNKLSCVKLKDRVRSEYTVSDLAKDVSAETSLGVRFPCIPDPLGLVRLQDGCWIVPGEDGLVGVEEVEPGFLAIPGVDPNLVHQNWVSNHYRMIVWALSSLERRGLAESALTLENLMSRLKLRYDREIDRAERSVLRKITEKDEPSSRPMILLVGRVGTDTLELSDGWYSLPCPLNYGDPLHQLVKEGKIKEGTKLVVQGCILSGGDQGSHPLDPGTRELQVDVNSCRRVVWWSRLGPCPPICIPVSSLRSGGGAAPLLRVVVARVYPILYCVRTENKTEYLSEKQWMVRQEQESQRREEMIMKAEKEQGNKKEKKRVSIKDLNLLEDGDELLEAVESEPGLYEYLNTQQREKVLIQGEERIAERRRQVESRMVEGDHKPNARPVLKLRVQDVAESSGSALISVWNPGGLQEILREGKILGIVGAQVKSVSGGTVYLTGTKTTQFIDIQYSRPLLRSVDRTLYSIMEIGEPDFKPLFNEVDLVGQVIMLEDPWTRAQTVYVCDETGLLQVVVWGGVESVGLSKVLAPGQIVSFRDLEWRQKSRTESICSVYIRDYSTVTVNPRSKLHTSRITELKTVLNLNPELVQEYLDRIESGSKAQSSRVVQGTKRKCYNASSLQETPGRVLNRETPVPRRISSAWTQENLSLCEDEPRSKHSSHVSSRLAKIDAYTSRLAEQGCVYSAPSPQPSWPKPILETPYRPPRISSPSRIQENTNLKESSVESQELEGMFMNIMDELNV